MSVRVNEDGLKITTMVIEARFDDAYRYLDKCGSVISKIRTLDSDWKVQRADPQSGNLTHRKHKLVLNLSLDKMSVGRDADEAIDRQRATAQIDSLAASAGTIYQIVTESFEVPNTTRLGMRFGFLAPADSVDEAHQFLARIPKSPLDVEIEKISGSEIYASTYRNSLEDPQTGIRQHVVIVAVRLNYDEQTTGFGGEEDRAEGGIVIDLDTYTRPTTGHFVAPERLVKDTYFAAFHRAVQIFDWMRKCQS